MNTVRKTPVSLEKRTFYFAVKVMRLLQKIKYSKENDVIRYQLAKAATSIGANYEESQGAFSKDDFRYKVTTCFKESKESNYWLRIINALELCPGEELLFLLRESSELKNIFGSITKKVNPRHML